jgi:hypothetical protein
MHRALLHTY